MKHIKTTYNMASCIKNAARLPITTESARVSEQEGFQVELASVGQDEMILCTPGVFEAFAAVLL